MYKRKRVGPLRNGRYPEFGGGIGEKRKKECRNPGLNQGPLDLQSNALPTELFRPTDNMCREFGLYMNLIIYCAHTTTHNI